MDRLWIRVHVYEFSMWIVYFMSLCYVFNINISCNCCILCWKTAVFEHKIRAVLFFVAFFHSPHLKREFSFFFSKSKWRKNVRYVLFCVPFWGFFRKLTLDYIVSISEITKLAAPAATQPIIIIIIIINFILLPLISIDQQVINCFAFKVLSIELLGSWSECKMTRTLWMIPDILEVHHD